MALDPIERDVGLSVADVFDKRLVFAQARTHLVEIGNLQVGAETHLARIGLEFPQNQAEQRCFAAAIRAHDADAVPAGDFRRKAVQERCSVVRIAHVGKTGDQAPRTVGLRNLHVHIARSGAARSAFFTHLDQRAHAALVTGPPRLDALADPDFFFGEALVKKRIGLFFFSERLVPELHELVVREVPATHAAAVEFQNARRGTAHEGTVVAHEEDGTFQTRDDTFQPLDGGDVQMVRRFVQQEQVRIARNSPCKEHATLLSTRKAVERSVRRNPRLSQDGFGVAVAHGSVRTANARHHHVAHRPFQVGRNFLYHPGNLEPRLFDDIAGVRFHLAGEHLQQGALAFAIATYQADTVARLDIERDIVQKGRTAKAERNILCGKNRHRNAI